MFQFLTISLLFAVFVVAPCNAEDMLYKYNAPESKLDKRYQYQWVILETALKKTTPEYGEYRLLESEFMTERRQVEEMESASGKLTVMYLDTNPRLEKKLIPIRIPVDKNLVGYRIFLIRRDKRHLFDNIGKLQDLKSFTYGLGLGWLDVDILRANNFKVVTGSNYEGLFDMLDHNRFDVFLRGAVEIVGEYEARKATYPNMMIEPNIVLYYPLPMYFWFPNTSNGKLLAQRAEKGMWMMIEDGTYDKIFYKFHGDDIKKLHLKQRKIYKIPNPLLVSETPFKDSRLWFDLNADKSEQ